MSRVVFFSEMEYSGGYLLFGLVAFGCGQPITHNKKETAPHSISSPLIDSFHCSFTFTIPFHNQLKEENWVEDIKNQSIFKQSKRLFISLFVLLYLTLIPIANNVILSSHLTKKWLYLFNFTINSLYSFLVLIYEFLLACSIMSGMNEDKRVKWVVVGVDWFISKTFGVGYGRSATLLNQHQLNSLIPFFLVLLFFFINGVKGLFDEFHWVWLNRR